MLAFEIDEGRDRRTGKAPYQHATRQHARNADKPAFATRQAVPPISEIVGHGTARIVIFAICRQSLPALGCAVTRSPPPFTVSSTCFISPTTGEANARARVPS